VEKLSWCLTAQWVQPLCFEIDTLSFLCPLICSSMIFLTILPTAFAKSFFKTPIRFLTSHLTGGLRRTFLQDDGEPTLGGHIK
jgi:hypothetical protein